MKHNLGIILMALLFPYIVYSQKDYYHGTAIIILRSQDSIYIGADSKMINLMTGESLYTCKIQFADDVAITTAGFVWHPDSNYSAMNLAMQAAQAEGNIFKKMEALEALIKEPLLKEWRNIVKQDSIDYHLQVAFCAFDGDTPIVIADRFYPQREGSGETFAVTGVNKRQIVAPTPGNRNPHYIIVLRQQPAIIEAAMQVGPGFKGNNVELINKMMEIIISKRSDVGGDIDIVCLTKGGKKWMQRKRDCPE